MTDIIKSFSDVPFRLKDMGDGTYAVVVEAVVGESTGLTDAQLRASPVAMAPNITRGAGNVDANTQRVTLAADGPTVTAIGAQADAAAAADGTGNYSIIAALKRGLLNWATLLGRIPALVSGRLPVQTDERPSSSAAAITPSDTTVLPGGTTRGIYVGVAGNVVALIGGTAITFTAVPAGSILPVAATRVNATGTTASGLVALF